MRSGTCGTVRRRSRTKVSAIEYRHARGTARKPILALYKSGIKLRYSPFQVTAVTAVLISLLDITNLHDGRQGIVADWIGIKAMLEDVRSQ